MTLSAAAGTAWIPDESKKMCLFQVLSLQANGRACQCMRRRFRHGCPTSSSKETTLQLQVNSLVSQQLRRRRRGETEFGHSARAVLRAEQAARLHYACGRQQKVRWKLRMHAGACQGGRWSCT